MHHPGSLSISRDHDLPCFISQLVHDSVSGMLIAYQSDAFADAECHFYDQKIHGIRSPLAEMPSLECVRNPMQQTSAFHPERQQADWPPAEDFYKRLNALSIP